MTQKVILPMEVSSVLIRTPPFFPMLLLPSNLTCLRAFCVTLLRGFLLDKLVLFMVRGGVGAPLGWM